MKETYTKQEVEALVKEIIHQDSFGDVHWAAGKVSNREGLNFTKPEESQEEAQ